MVLSTGVLRPTDLAGSGGCQTHLFGVAGFFVDGGSEQAHRPPNKREAVYVLRWAAGQPSDGPGFAPPHVEG